MQVLIPLPKAWRPDRLPRAPRLVASFATVATLFAALANTAAAACPWIVQPVSQSASRMIEAPAFDIVFDGLDPQAKVFYGFTVTSVDLAWQLVNERDLPRLGDKGRRLLPVTTRHDTVAYRPAPETVEPQTIYLVAADGVIEELESIDARIEPSRPLAVSQLWPKTRGGTDLSGPLPHRSLPGIEIARSEEPAATASDAGRALSAGIQICAYQVAMR